MAAQNPQQLATTKGMFARYRGMIVLIAVFLTAISVLMVGSLLLSAQVRKNADELSTVTELHLATHEIGEALLNLKTNYGEDPNSPHIVSTLKTLRHAQGLFQQGVTVLHDGGTFQLSDGQETNVAKLTGDNFGHLEQILALWQPISKDIDSYLETANLPTATSVPLDLAVLRMKSNSANLNEHVEAVQQNLQSEVQKSTNILTWLQTTGVVSAILFFVLFISLGLRKLFASDLATEAARRETTEIMDTVNTGLFLLDQDLNIGSQYSKQLETLLGQKNIGNRNLMDILGGLISDEDLNTTHAFIGQLYNPKTKERLISSLNPLVRQPMQIPGRAANDIRYLDFKFNRVYHGKEIARVLVNVSDVTDAVQLERKIEQEREQNDVQLEMLSTILQADRSMINSFVSSIKRRAENINNTLKAPGERHTELRGKVESIFREVHSLKGEASAVKLHGFTVMAENVEKELKKLSQSVSLSGEDFLGLAVHLEELMKLTQTIEDLVHRLGNNTIGEGFAKNKTSPTESATVNYYNQFVADLAQRNNKQVDFAYSGVASTQNESTDAVIREIAVQLLRNAVVHGIETAERRQAVRKLSAGHVRMSLTENGNDYTLVLEDDGKGIDYEAIRAKAVRLGLYDEQTAAQLSSKELLGLIFSSGFSTLDESTEDAGRGVGLDIIKDRVAALGGKIGVATHTGAYTRFTFTFPK
ncbi:MAG: ATP-binding protein [Alysiella sp.]|uniref:ATP-binding protein n=1 Tax=Alysiella sp. TaxID=1872483 RepID=UPI0026DD5D47|nr:ATP-binding protein [Alysiella sp.]MDO4432989.1 ATP-binding protein [Alysiella sp.]